MRTPSWRNTDNLDESDPGNDMNGTPASPATPSQRRRCPAGPDNSALGTGPHHQQTGRSARRSRDHSSAASSAPAGEGHLALIRSGLVQASVADRHPACWYRPGRRPGSRKWAVQDRSSTTTMQRVSSLKLARSGVSDRDHSVDAVGTPRRRSVPRAKTWLSSKPGRPSPDRSAGRSLARWGRCRPADGHEGGHGDHELHHAAHDPGDGLQLHCCAQPPMTST